MKKQEKSIETVNENLLNIITPMGIQFYRNHLEIGENVGRAYSIIQYPQTVDTGWLAHISSMPGTIVSCTIQPTDGAALVEAISRDIVRQRGISDTTHDPIVQQRAQVAAEDGERLMIQIDQRGEAVVLMSCMVMPFARDAETMNQTSRKLNSQCAIIRARCRALSHMQQDAYKQLSPYYVSVPEIDRITQRIMPLSTFVGGLPCSSTGYTDNVGSLWAHDTHGGLIIVDPWRREQDHTNSNMVLIGPPGTGKSTAIKSICISEYMRGTKLIFIDPENEYKDLCLALGGDWVDMGGAGGRINPYQVWPVPLDDDNDEETPLYGNEQQPGINALALHMMTLDIIHGLYLPDLTDVQKALLKETVEEVYAAHGITWETDINQLDATDYPTAKDIYLALRRKARAKKAQPDNAYETLAALFRSAAIGADGYILNGHTSVQAHSRCVCLDTHALTGMSDALKRTQYMLMTAWAWQQLSNDRHERVLLVCDEAYLMIDPAVPQALAFLRNAAKRARKYEAGIITIFHSIVDVIDPSVKLYGQALLDTPTYKLIFGSDGPNLKELTELYGLTQAEQDLLYARKRGHALMMLGSCRIHSVFHIPDYKLQLMGGRGGR